MNIILVTNNYYPNVGGIANVLVNLYNYFQKTEHKLYVFNPFSNNSNEFNILTDQDFCKKDLAYFLRFKKFDYYLIYSFWKIISDKKIPFSHRIKIITYFLTKPEILIKVIENINRLYPYLKKLKFDIIVAGHSGWILPLVFLLSRIFNKKVVSIAYGNDFLTLNPLSLKTFFFKNIDKIIVINYQMKNLIKKMHHLKENQLKVISVGINSKNLKVNKSKKELREEFNIPEDIFVLLSVGRHVLRKRFDLVIKAVSEIKKLKPSIKLKYFLIGNGQETTNLKKLTRNLNLENDVEFLGSCESEKRNKFYKLSDVFIMPSITISNDIEGFGIVFLEANYYKVPVIGSYSGGMLDAVIDGKTGYLIKPNDLSDLVERIFLLYENEQLRKKLGENGHKRVINEFTWEKVIEDFINVFKNLLYE